MRNLTLYPEVDFTHIEHDGFADRLKQQLIDSHIRLGQLMTDIASPLAELRPVVHAVEPELIEKNLHLIAQTAVNMLELLEKYREETSLPSLPIPENIEKP